jgi:hypothetical protein
MTNKQVHREYLDKPLSGGIAVTVWEEGGAMVSVDSIGAHVCLHFTLEDAKFVRDTLDRGISEYEAGIDRYHDICDEPPVAEPEES